MDKVKDMIHKAVKPEKPIKLYSHSTGPNPWKVAIILEELNLPYQNIFMEFGDLKKEPFISINPNGRVPAIEDPNNNNIKLFESGAIIQYLIDTYDHANKLSSSKLPEKYEELSWFHFQTSGQGPYYGQKAWFSFFHPEKGITSAVDRYGNEIRRVLGVIDAHLKKNGTQYLVGNKASYADLAFVPWHLLVVDPLHIMGEEFPAEWQTQYPLAWAWNQRLLERPSVVKVRADRKAAMAK